MMQGGDVQILGNNFSRTFPSLYFIIILKYFGIMVGKKKVIIICKAFDRQLCQKPVSIYVVFIKSYLPTTYVLM